MQIFFKLVFLYAKMVVIIPVVAEGVGWPFNF